MSYLFSELSSIKEMSSILYWTMIGCFVLLFSIIIYGIIRAILYLLANINAEEIEVRAIVVDKDHKIDVIGGGDNSGTTTKHNYYITFDLDNGKRITAKGNEDIFHFAAVSDKCVIAYKDLGRFGNKLTSYKKLVKKQ